MHQTINTAVIFSLATLYAMSQKAPSCWRCSS